LTVFSEFRTSQSHPLDLQAESTFRWNPPPNTRLDRHVMANCYFEKKNDLKLNYRETSAGKQADAIYSKTINCNQSMSINDFRNNNEAVIKRVYDEAKSIFNYELTHEQISRAINVYFITKFNPSSVLETKTFEVERLGLGFNIIN
jgi:hypothetical protein